MLVTRVSLGPPGSSTALKSGPSSLHCSSAGLLNFERVGGGCLGMVAEEGCVCVSAWRWGLCSSAGTKHVNTISMFNKFGNKQGFPSNPHWRLLHLSLTAGENPRVYASSFSPALLHVKLKHTRSVI